MAVAEHFDAVVIGSGFGGSVAAYRLAEGGLSVCLLERGKAYPPGSFPRTPYGMKRNFWDPSEGLYGMFDLWSFKGLEALVSSALGGGSIIYANVLLRKDEKWFAQEDLENGGYEYWPITRSELEPHYDAAEAMLNGQRYPFDVPPYSKTCKTNALKEAAEKLNLHWELPKLAVTFANDGEAPVPGEPIKEAQPNMHGRTRLTCRLCGECDVGCNYGSKNTLDYNYLTHAQRHGAEIRTLCEVRTFRPRDGGGYEIGYVEHNLEFADRKRNTADLPLVTITADRLVLAAGTLGSNHLMLKNRQHFPGISPKLGHRFCGNGDLLGFALRCSEQRDGGKYPRSMDPSYAPVITSTIRMGDGLDGTEGSNGRGFYLQDAGFPSFASWVVESANVGGMVLRAIKFAFFALRARFRRDSNLSAEIQTILADVTSSTSVPLLGMGRDVPNGTFSLDGNRLTNDWKLDSSHDYFKRLKETMEAVADSFGAEKFIINPTWFLNRVITVHALGGCAMARNPEQGVVGANGEVFGFPGFYIADGSIMPGPVGANPSLTIAAMADLISDGILERRSATP